MSTTDFIVLIVIASIVAFVMLRKGETLRFETSLDAHRVIMAAVGVVATRKHWQTLGQDDHRASFQYNGRPNVLIALALLVCGLVPGVLYIVLACKRESLIVNVDWATPQMIVVQVTSNGYRGKFAGRALRRQIGLPEASLGSGRTPAPVYGSPVTGRETIAGRQAIARPDAITKPNAITGREVA